MFALPVSFVLEFVIACSRKSWPEIELGGTVSAQQGQGPEFNPQYKRRKRRRRRRRGGREEKGGRRRKQRQETNALLLLWRETQCLLSSDACTQGVADCNLCLCPEV